MDWWSFLFVSTTGGALIYTGLGLMWFGEYIFTRDQVKRVWIKRNYSGLVLAWFTMAFTATLLFGLHHLGVITMWEVGYAIQRGL